MHSLEEAQKLAKGIGFPLVVKAASGGGGRGMKVANRPEELSEAFSSARPEAPLEMILSIWNAILIIRAISKFR